MNLERYYRGKVVVITGSSRGIGRETARLALRWGARVVINGRDPETLAETQKELGVTGFVSDVSTPEGARTLMEQALALESRIDVVIANAGRSMRGAFAELVPATVNAMVESNLMTAVWTTQAALPALRASNGTLTFISSLAAVRGFPGVSLYSASKMAVTALHQAVGAEEPSVRSCLVYLSFTQNDQDKTVLGADGQPFRQERRASTTQDQAAHAILKATARGRRQTILTAAGHLLFWGQSVFPWLLDFVLTKSGGRIHSVRRPS